MPQFELLKGNTVLTDQNLCLEIKHCSCKISQKLISTTHCHLPPMTQRGARHEMIVCGIDVTSRRASVCNYVKCSRRRQTREFSRWNATPEFSQEPVISSGLIDQSIVSSQSLYLTVGMCLMKNMDVLILRKDSAQTVLAFGPLSPPITSQVSIFPRLADRLKLISGCLKSSKMLTYKKSCF
ncbi:hypothetical protein Q8A67_019969 [Cirrhinus molitorella]|uniref:Uncharacterized protein n=1 Tax=Cirrhinus molitorella TaxID=172907 RepID=A0AA88TQ76_9TELE|nr:hypothetical protein Q8A67_019969 [Cirrhinus molitorella]